MKYQKFIYRNFFGDYKVLISVSKDETSLPNDNTVPRSETYDAHIWFHNNKLVKNHTGNSKLTIRSLIRNGELEEIFSNDTQFRNTQQIL